MTVKDYNQMSLFELRIISRMIDIEFQINDGKIVGAVKKNEE